MNNLLIHILSQHAEIMYLRGLSEDSTTFTSVNYTVEEVYEYNDFWQEEQLDKYIVKGRALHHKCDFYAEVASTGVVLEFKLESEVQNNGYLA